MSNSQAPKHNSRIAAFLPSLTDVMFLLPLAFVLARAEGVRDMIEGNIQQLKSDLQQQGLRVERVEVAVADDRREQPGRQAWTGAGRKGHADGDVAPVAAETGPDCAGAAVPGAPIVEGGSVRARASVPSSISSCRCLAWPTGPGCSLSTAPTSAACTAACATARR